MGCEKYMSNINKSLDYVSMASLFEGEGLKILIAYKGEKKLENFFILNEFDSTYTRCICGTIKYISYSEKPLPERI